MLTVANIALLVVVGCYLAATVVYFIEFFRGPFSKLPLGLLLTGTGFLADCLFHLTRAGSHTGPQPYTLAYSLSNLGWVVILAFLLAHLKWRIPGLGAFLVPIPLTFLLIALRLSAATNPVVIQSRGAVLTVHIVVLVLGHAAFAFAFVLALLYLVVRWALKTKQQWFMQFTLPSLQTLDQMGLLFLRTGFPLMTLGLLSGSVLLNQLAPETLLPEGSWYSKEVWSLLSWCVYAVLLASRSFFGLTPKRGAYLAIFGFLSILLSLFGTDHLFEQAP